MYRDVVDVLEQAGDRLDLIMIPKVGTAADVYAVDMLVTQVEAGKARKKRIGFELIIETALGMANIDEIAARLQAQRDRCISASPTMPPARARAPPTSAAPNPDYAVLTDKAEDGSARRSTGATCGTTPSPAWWWRPAPMACGRSTARSATSPTPTASGPRRAARPCWAARASGRSTPRRSRSPTRSSRRPRRRSTAPGASSRRWSRPRKEGKGAVSLDGRLIDIASIRQAEALVAKADMLGKPA